MKTIKFMLVILTVIVMLGVALVVGRGITGTWNPAEWGKSEDKPVEGNENDDNNPSSVDVSFDLGFNDVQENCVKMSFAKLPRNAYRANGVDDNALISYTVNAEVYPNTAPDKRLSWDLTCDDDINVSTYLTLTSVTDYSCVVVCKKAFPDYVFTLKATSLESGVFASIKIRCEGIPTDMSVVDLKGNNELSASWNNQNEFTINLTNDIGFIGESYAETITIKSVTLAGTVDTYGKYFVSTPTSGTSALTISPSYTETHKSKDINEYYSVSDLFTLSVNNQTLIINASAYPVGTFQKSDTGYLHNGTYGTMLTNVVTSPTNVYLTITLSCGNIYKTVHVDLNVGVVSVNLGNDIVW